LITESGSHHASYIIIIIVIIIVTNGVARIKEAKEFLIKLGSRKKNKG
jgi:hypothetical protein